MTRISGCNTLEQHTRERAEAVQAELQQERARYREEISTLQREIGRLEARLEIAQQSAESDTKTGE